MHLQMLEIYLSLAFNECLVQKMFFMHIRDILCKFSLSGITFAYKSYSHIYIVHRPLLKWAH